MPTTADDRPAADTRPRPARRWINPFRILIALAGLSVAALASIGLLLLGQLSG